MAIRPKLIYSLWSVKRLGVFLLNLDGMLVHRRATSGIHVYTCNHCHVVGTRTPYLSRPPAPTRSILFTNRKSANSQGVRTNCAFQHWMWERGCVWANDLWQWLWVQRGTLRVKCLAQERNVSSQGSNQNLSVQSSANANNEAFRPPTIT